MNAKSKVRINQRPNKSIPNPPLSLKAEIDLKTNQFVVAELDKQYVQNAFPPLKPTNNYITQIYTKWHGRYFYFCAQNASPGRHMPFPTFESKFARLEYTGPLRFNLAYLRHTRTWFEVGNGLNLDECFAWIKYGVEFHLSNGIPAPSEDTRG